MAPRQDGVGPATRRQADTGPPRALPATGPLLRGLFQRAGSRAPSFCALLLLPRVHAAEDPAAAQTASSDSPLSSSSSSFTTTPTAGPAPIGSTRLPETFGKPEFPDTGWDRVKDLFDGEGAWYRSEELSSVWKSGLAGAVLGLFHGGLPAARHARQRYIQLSQAELYFSHMDAVRSSHNAAIRGFIRYGFRWSWRVAAFAMLFNSVSTGLSVYRDKDVLSHYVAAGALTGGLFRINLGLRGLVAGTLIGSVLGLPAGALVAGMQMAAGETMRDRTRRERREQYHVQLGEWSARLQLTDELIGDLSVNIKENQDMQKIQQLLDQPRNEDLEASAEGP